MSPEIDYKYYKAKDSYNDLSERNKVPKQNYVITLPEMIRCAHTVGLGSLATFPPEVLRWKAEVVHAFLDFSSTKITVKNLESLELSEKGSAFYSIGMILAQSFMQNFYQIQFLAHLNSPGLYPNSKSGKSPDLWGLSKSGLQSYLVEAKGSSQKGNYIPKSQVDDALIQLEDIEVVTFVPSVGYIQKFEYSTLKKLVVATHPSDEGNITQHIIDPEDGNQTVIRVDGNTMVSDYYSYLTVLLEEGRSELVTIQGLKFKVIQIQDKCRVGVLEEIYDELIDNRQKHSSDLNSYNHIKTILDESKLDVFSNAEMAIGHDGVIVMMN